MKPGFLATFLASRQRPGRAEFILRYAFPDELRRRIVDLYPTWTPRQIDLVLEGLRQFMLACLDSQSGRGIAGTVGMPSKAVDAAWHEFIVMTRDYAEFSEQAFGRYLHHAPKRQMTEPLDAALANTLHQYRSRGAHAAGYTALAGVPLLFALDRELGLAGGHHYQPADLEALERKRQSMVASHGGADGGSADGGGSHCDSADGGGGGCGGGGGGGGCGGGGCGGG
jgi:hypothetical protein